MQEFDIDGAIFGADPISKLIDVLRGANKNLVESEIQKFLSKVAAVELMLEQRGVSDAEVGSFLFENADTVLSRVNSLAMNLTADILTQNE